MPLTDVLNDHDRVRTRQSSADVAVDARIARLRQLLSNLRVDCTATPGLLHELSDEAEQVSKALSSEQKAVGAGLTRLGRSIDSNTSKSLSTLCASHVRLQCERVNESVSEHLFRQGLFSLAHAFAAEANVEVDEAKVAPFRRLHVILDAYRAGELGPAIAWASEERERLGDSDLEVRLHRLAYLRLLQRGCGAEALAYARTQFSRFPDHDAELGKLMTCMLYATRLANSPYRALVSDTHRDDIERALTREYCKTLQLGPESSLLTIVRCGAKAIPNLLKAARVAPNWRDLGNDEVLPVEVDVGRECQFHSIFTCPVSREETSDGPNVPMMLPCGHVLSKQSISRLPKGQQRFKCPYCPREQLEKECREVRF